MLRKNSLNLLRIIIGSSQTKLQYSQREILQVYQISDSNKNNKSFINNCIHNFSTQRSKQITSKIIKNDENKQQKSQDSTQSIQTIQVSIQQFRKMKQLLHQLKAQISDLQQQQTKPNHNDSLNNKKAIQTDINLSTKILSFNKQSKIAQNINNQENSSLFFKSQQQQLSFQLIKLNSKQQFNELIQNYLTKLTQIQQQNIINKKNQNSFNQLIKLSYLIFYRYSTLQNAKIDDQPIKNLLFKIVSNIDILQQFQVEKLLSILNDQIKERECQWVNQQNNMYKMNAILHSNFKDFVKDIKKCLLTNNKVLNFKSKSNKNSQILSLICHFFNSQQLSQSSYQVNLQKHMDTNQNSQKKIMIYNPANLSHLIINAIQSGKNHQNISELYELFQHSLKINEAQFTSQQAGYLKIEIEDSLKQKSGKDFERYQYEGIIYFLQNCPQSNNNFFLKFSSLIFAKDRQLQKFQLIHQLRICLGFLIRPQLLKIDQTFDNKIITQVYRILLSSQTKDSLLQIPKQDNQLFQTNDNVEFLHLKKVAMILSQIGIQLFKNYRTIVKQRSSDEIVGKLKEIIPNILLTLNKVCIEKVDLKDIFKNQQKQNVSQRLILNLNLFQFIVNLNILSKWSNSVTQSSINQQLSQQLLANLVTIFINQTKSTLINQNHYLQQFRLKLAEQLLIILLIGKQNSVILKSLLNYFESSQNKQIFADLLKNTIGKNNLHKYHQQYSVIQKQFQF